MSSFLFQTSDFLLQTSAVLQTSPVIVKIVEPKEDTLYDVLFGALGLTGVMVAIAVAAAVVLGGVLFWVRSRSEEVHLKVDTTSEIEPPTGSRT